MNWLKVLLIGALSCIPALATVYPSITNISPASGPEAGGTLVTITGTGFLAARYVQFGDSFLSSGFTVVNDTTLTLITPSSTVSGSLPVAVENLFGGDDLTSSFDYTDGPVVSGVNPTSGPLSGGTQITITGSGFTGATAVTIGGTPVPSFVQVNDTTITATTPAGALGAAGIVVAAGGLSSPSALLFTYAIPAVPALQISAEAPLENMQVAQNESVPVSATAFVFANDPGYTWIASTATPWLTLTQSTGSFPGVVGMTANANGLAIGSYIGSVTVTAGGLTIPIPVDLTVLPPASLTASPSGLYVATGYQAGSASGWDIQIAPAGVAFTAATSASSSGWLSISPLSGTGPAAIHVAIDPSKATPGIYQDSIVVTSPGGTPNSPMSIPVKLAVTTGFTALLENQTASASGGGPDHTVAPNEIVSLNLTDFSCTASPVVAINGRPVDWSTWSSGQFRYEVPASFSLPGSLSVACDGNTAWSFNGLNLAASLPGIFTVNGSGTGQAAVTNDDGSVNGPDNPARRGTSISTYVSGFGVYSPAGSDGLRHLAGTVTAQVGGVPAEVQYAGESPGNIDGLQQINLLIPIDSPVGPSDALMFWINGTPTQANVTISLQ